MRHGAWAGRLPHVPGVPHLHVNWLVCMNQQVYRVVRRVTRSFFHSESVQYGGNVYLLHQQQAICTMTYFLLLRGMLTWRQGTPDRLRNRFSWGNPRVRIISHMVTPPPCKQASLHESVGLQGGTKSYQKFFLIARVFSMGVTCIYFTNNRPFAQ